ncbi:peptide deformylase [Microbacterium sp. EYE_5]|uniref:peptide deformylase n=1 Tax=unclassified Microbacterium TaxID=2609290 RepID=UPI002005B372|nr:MULTISPECIES: peptide deformylase [unclassified Microbacterium]MCK6080429.1 peptide deformylase [Microbacterium sp. EYE_382]MCK6085700.1 peptide deformylase [Microbacterium sp. EYE_384]MCK6124802.1 peptide deformylase [Microbacterium sp. EYE_80]MCK6127711.1 peptide deformylase [Microbacterium sp. EYE_79]MCK6141384.1 peptide deformylase [Microbacterium sp. EYE_39]
MAVRPIRLFGDPVLRSVSARIIDIDEGVHALVTDLLDSVAEPGRAGVAAPQIGVGLRAFSYNVDGVIGYILNPELEVDGEPAPTGEGCLSVPGLWHDALRHPWARVTGVDLHDEEIVIEGEGLLAQALQHEYDHLEGMLYLDRLPKDVRRQAMREVRESDWF